MANILGKGTVLIVDNNAERLESLKNEIVSLGYTISIQKTAKTALRKIRSRSVNAVLLSSSIDDVDTGTFLETLREANIVAGIVIYGREIGAEKAVNWMQSGAVDILFDVQNKKKIEEAIHRAFTYSIRYANQDKTTSSGLKESSDLLYRSTKMVRIVKKARTVAPVKATVLLTGESGTGKDVLAKYIHEQSGRRGSYIPINCAAIPETLLEDELFGHEKGAYTGADTARAGKFEAATGGTLLLDEIAEIPLTLQVKLLRILEESELTRIGGNSRVKIDVRLIAATNADLSDAVRRGAFREDLYYRLKVIEIHLPPLRGRKQDVPILAISFLRQAAEKHGLPIPEITPDALQKLAAFGWPGNVRQLKNLMENLLIVGGNKIDVKQLPAEISGVSIGTNPKLCVDMPITLDELEKLALQKTLEMVGGNRTRAAELLGIGRRTLQRKIKEDLS